MAIASQLKCEKEVLFHTQFESPRSPPHNCSNGFYLNIKKTQFKLEKRYFTKECLCVLTKNLNDILN